MNKPFPSAEASAEAGFTSILNPMQEGLGRLHKASERLSAIYAEIATDQAQFIQRVLFDALYEMQTLSRVRGPAEYFQESAQFAWQQAERSLKAFGEIGSEISSCWFEALNAASARSQKTAERKAGR